MVNVVDLQKEREARQTVEDVVDILSLAEGAVAVFAELCDGFDFYWELDANQARVLIAGLELALSGRCARITQPAIKAIPRQGKFASSLV